MQKLASQTFAELLTPIGPLFNLYDRLISGLHWQARNKSSLEPKIGSNQAERPPCTLGIDELLQMEIPQRALLLDPILPAEGLMMIHARRGGSITSTTWLGGRLGRDRAGPPPRTSAACAQVTKSS